MGGYYGLAVLVGVASLLTTGRCDVNCKGVDGQQGVVGIPGRNGWPGVKGEKGEPALTDSAPVDTRVLLMLKGEMGSRGEQGVRGPKGFQGSVGASGKLGQTGLPGNEGKNIGQGQNAQQRARSAFSVIRNDRSYPRFEQRITYQMAQVNTGDFRIDTGYFTCSVPGVYYFNFHSVAKVGTCLRIASEALVNKVGFCDHNTKQNDQVMSGGVVLELAVGERVWLESFRGHMTIPPSSDTRDKQIIFNGFLLFPN